MAGGYTKDGPIISTLNLATYSYCEERLISTVAKERPPIRNPSESVGLIYEGSIVDCLRLSVEALMSS